MRQAPAFDDVTAEVDGNALCLIFDGARRLSQLLDTIAGAQESLRLFFYIFVDDPVGRDVRDALVAASARGVKVWLFVDGFGSGETGDVFFAPLVQAGGRFGRFNSRFGTRYLLRNHQKIVIADGRVAIIGGANVQQSYFQANASRWHWHDIALRIEGPAVHRLVGYFDALRRWILGEKHKLRGMTQILARRSDRKGSLRWLFNGPFRRMSPLTLALKHDLEVGQRVEMMQAYFAPNWGMLRRIGRIMKRGGLFRLIVSSVSDNRVTVGAARHCYGGILKRGGAIYEWRDQPLHAKLMIMDDIVYVGSANFDMRSLFINGEVMLRIDDATFAAGVRATFDAHLSDCREITPQLFDAMARPFARLGWLISYFIVSTVDFTITRRFSLKRRARKKIVPSEKIGR